MFLKWKDPEYGSAVLGLSLYVKLSSSWDFLPWRNCYRNFSFRGFLRQFAEGRSRRIPTYYFFFQISVDREICDVKLSWILTRVFIRFMCLLAKMLTGQAPVEAHMAVCTAAPLATPWQSSHLKGMTARVSWQSFRFFLRAEVSDLSRFVSGVQWFLLVLPVALVYEPNVGVFLASSGAFARCAWCPAFSPLSSRCFPPVLASCSCVPFPRLCLCYWGFALFSVPSALVSRASSGISPRGFVRLVGASHSFLEEWLIGFSTRFWKYSS